MSAERSLRLPVLSIALLSATAIAYEILLVRLFAIIQWHHFAYMVISLALLGYGASGTFLAFTLKPLLRQYRAALLSNMALFGVATMVCFLLAQTVAFNPDEVAFDTLQWIKLVSMYLLLSVPFFFAANAIGLALAKAQQQLPQIYAADLLGAGIGSLAIVVLLFLVFPLTALQLITIMGVASALLGAMETRLKSVPGWLALTVLLIMIAALPAGRLTLEPSAYKELSQILRITGTSIIKQDSSPLGLISVVESPVVPLRHAPGLSINATTEPPRQLGVFVDGNGPSVINNIKQADSPLAYLSQMTSALPFDVSQPDHVLIPGSGAGTDVLQALQLSQARIDAVEINPQTISLLRHTYAEYAGGLYDHPRVRIINAEGRGFLHSTNNQYDLIQIPPLDSFGSSSTGLLALHEDYLYTVETFQQYLQHLTPNGLLAINRWIRIPPRDTLKALATAIAAMHQLNIEDIDKRLALLRGWQTSILLVKNGTFTDEEIMSIRKFSRQHAFDLAYIPGIKADEVNRYNRLAKPYFYLAAKQLLGPERGDFIERYKFNLQPATNDRPYFFHFFRWQSLPEIMQLYGKGGVPLIDTGYLVMIATLLQAGLASVLLVLLPLYFLKRRAKLDHEQVSTSRVFIYFGALGLGFLLIEIAFIQKLTLFLHHPLYAVAVSLAAFLLFAGLGSRWSSRLTERHDNKGIQMVVGMLVLLSMLYLLGLDLLFAQLIHLPDAVRILISIIIIAPLAFFLGMPFPMGMTRLTEFTPHWLPWAWGINGCASVMSAVLATLIAIHYGFTTVILIAILLYLIAMTSFPKADN